MNLDALQNLLNEFEGGGRNKTAWFSLKDDGDSAEVRILTEGLRADGTVDLPIYVVHRVKGLGQWGRNIKCLEGNCPLCRAGHQKQLKLFLPMVVKGGDADIFIWERGIVDIKKLISISKEYGALNERDFKITRNGGKGDPRTTYEFFPRDKTDRDLPSYNNSIILSRDSYYVLDLPYELVELAAQGRLTDDIVFNGGGQQVQSTEDVNNWFNTPTQPTQPAQPTQPVQPTQANQNFQGAVETPQTSQNFQGPIEPMGANNETPESESVIDALEFFHNDDTNLF